MAIFICGLLVLALFALHVKSDVKAVFKLLFIEFSFKESYERRDQ